MCAAAPPTAPSRRRFWKSVDELADTPQFLEFLHREFPEQASMFEDAKGRREFLTLMGASLALAGLTACTKQPEERIYPYVRQPEGMVPGRPLFFASAYGHDGYARGILVESHEGRPTKIEGNPDHPVSLGATDVFGQAHVLGLYDPDRSKSVLSLGQDRTWGDFRGALREELEKQQGEGRRGPALPDAPQHVADARRPGRDDHRGVPRGDASSAGSRCPATTRGRAPRWRSASRSRRTTASTRPTSC